ncbi:MAG: peptidase M23, partial [Deltaproteobacteria bacterium]
MREVILGGHDELAALARNDPTRLAKRIEGMMWQIVVRELGRGSHGGLVPAGLAGEVFGDMLAQAIAQKATEGSELGLADVIVRQLGLERRNCRSFCMPVDGRVTSRYGYRRDPLTGERAFHHGLDIAAPEGTPVRAVGSGTVVQAQRLGGYGLAVVVQQDDGARVIYGHCSRSLAEPGQRVAAGQTIAQVGQTGRATGPHLHLEVR